NEHDTARPVGACLPWLAQAELAGRRAATSRATSPRGAVVRKEARDQEGGEGGNDGGRMKRRGQA
ncbi:unnamed protein product, partial [Prorocentrum cordatum]